MRKKKDDGSIIVIEKKPDDRVGHRLKTRKNLKMLQDTVGGYIETVTLAEDLVIICNENGRCIGTDEEGNMISLPYNCTVAGVDFVGTILVAGVSGDEFADCPLTLDEWAEKWLQEEQR